MGKYKEIRFFSFRETGFDRFFTVAKGIKTFLIPLIDIVLLRFFYIHKFSTKYQNFLAKNPTFFRLGSQEKSKTGCAAPSFFLTDALLSVP